MTRSLAGRNVVITGAARGIGERIARFAVAKGANVALIGLEPDLLRALAKDLGPSVCWQEADVRDGASLRAAIDHCATVIGGIDFAVANAGVVACGTVRQIDDTAFEQVIDINISGVFRTLKYATPHLARSKGHAVVVSSAIAFTPLPGYAAYAASKAGVENLALSYRQEVAHLGITVGLVHPAFIDTDLIRNLEADIPSFQQMLRRLPYPFNSTTSVDRAAGAIVNGLERRRARVYVPRAVVVANWTKALANSTVGWQWFKRFAAQVVPPLESEAASSYSDGHR